MADAQEEHRHHMPKMMPGAPRPEEYSAAELRNIATVREYMHIAYDPQRASADAVRHLVAVATEVAPFEAPTTFPTVHDVLAYAEVHGGARGMPCADTLRLGLASRRTSHQRATKWQ
jgi:hypothetical protein